MRLIDVDALMVSLKISNTGCGECESVDPNYGICMRDFAEACTAIKEAPIIEERKSGEWIPEFDGKFTGGAYWFSCSKCKRIVPEVRNGGWNFCPNCGADMRGKHDERAN